MRYFVLGLALITVGCSSSARERTHHSVAPMSTARYDQFVAICRGRAASGVTVAPNVPRDPYDRLAGSIIRGGSVEATFDGCMAEYGLVR